MNERALLIGVSCFGDSLGLVSKAKLENMKSALLDAGFDSSQIDLLFDPTESELMSFVASSFRTSHSELVIFFCGEGSISSRSHLGKLALIASDSCLDNMEPGVNLSFFENLSLSYPDQKISLILDCAISHFESRHAREVALNRVLSRSLLPASLLCTSTFERDQSEAILSNSLFCHMAHESYLQAYLDRSLLSARIQKLDASRKVEHSTRLMSFFSILNKVDLQDLSHKELVSDYCRISNSTEISAEDEERFNILLEVAEKDKSLAEYFAEIDSLLTDIFISDDDQEAWEKSCNTILAEWGSSITATHDLFLSKNALSIEDFISVTERDLADSSHLVFGRDEIPWLHYRAAIIEYYHLSVKSVLSESDADTLEMLLERAESDTRFSAFAAKIDALIQEKETLDFDVEQEDSQIARAVDLIHLELSFANAQELVYDAIQQVDMVSRRVEKSQNTISRLSEMTAKEISMHSPFSLAFRNMELDAFALVSNIQMLDHVQDLLMSQLNEIPSNLAKDFGVSRISKKLSFHWRHLRSLKEDQFFSLNCLSARISVLQKRIISESYIPEFSYSIPENLRLVEIVSSGHSSSCLRTFLQGFPPELNDDFLACIRLNYLGCDIEASNLCSALTFSTDIDSLSKERNGERHNTEILSKSSSLRVLESIDLLPRGIQGCELGEVRLMTSYPEDFFSPSYGFDSFSKHVPINRYWKSKDIEEKKGKKEISGEFFSGTLEVDSPYGYSISISNRWRASQEDKLVDFKAGFDLILDKDCVLLSLKTSQYPGFSQESLCAQLDLSAVNLDDCDSFDFFCAKKYYSGRLDKKIGSLIVKAGKKFSRNLIFLPDDLSRWLRVKAKRSKLFKTSFSKSVGFHEVKFSIRKKEVFQSSSTPSRELRSARA